MYSKNKNQEHVATSKGVKHHFEPWQEVHEKLGCNLQFKYQIKGYQSRLDRIYVKENVIKKVIMIKYKIKSITCTFSDNDQLYMELKWGSRPK